VPKRGLLWYVDSVTQNFGAVFDCCWVGGGDRSHPSTMQIDHVRRNGQAESQARLGTESRESGNLTNPAVAHDSFAP
jgi:hypothetical protein